MIYFRETSCEPKTFLWGIVDVKKHKKVEKNEMIRFFRSNTNMRTFVMMLTHHYKFQTADPKKWYKIKNVKSKQAPSAAMFSRTQFYRSTV